MQFPPVPPEIKSIAHFLKIAEEHEERNIAIAYWARMFACQRTMVLIPGKKSSEVTKLLMALMDWMEKAKKENLSNDGITDEAAASAIIENYALQLFTHGDQQDRAQVFNKNTIKAFYTAGILMDILEQFGPLSEDIQNKRKYAKWKAAYIHNCLKTGDIPIPGAPDEHLQNVVHRSDLVDDPEPPEQHKAAPPPPEDSEAPFIPPITPQPSVAPQSPTLPVMPQNNFFNPQPVNPTPPSASSSFASLPPDKIKKAQKYCKFAESALDYEDFKTAVDNLNKALHLIQTGQEL